MMRNDDLVRDLLELVANADGTVNAYELDGYSRKEVLFHVQILAEAGLIIANIQNAMGAPGVVCEIERMTFAGTDYYAAIQSPRVWSAVKNKLIDHSVGLSLDAIAEVARKVALSQMGLL